MTDRSEAKTRGELRAEIAALHRQLAAQDARRRWIAPAIESVSIAAHAPAVTTLPSPGTESPEPRDQQPRYVPWLTPRFWEESRLDRTRYDTFVESGSYRGDTLDFMKDRFRTLHSIELSKRWHDFCAARFRDQPHVHLYRGDSAALLPRILQRIEGPAIVFLDAHYSGGSTAKADARCDSPLLAELACLQARSFDDIVIVDDTSFFGAKGGAEPGETADDQVWPTFAYDWSGITRDRVLSLMKPGYRFIENTGSQYTLTPREDQLVLYPPARSRG